MRQKLFGVSLNPGLRTIGWGVAAFLCLGGPAAALDRAALLAPFETQNPNLFHATLGVPRLEAADPVPAETTRLRFRTDHSDKEMGPSISGTTAQQVLREGGTFEPYYLGRFHTWLAVEAAYGATPRLELRARAAIGGWDEHRDHFYFLDDERRAWVRGEGRDLYGQGASGRDDDLTDTSAGLKFKLGSWESAGMVKTLAVAADVKFPVGQANNLVDAGTTDLALKLLGSMTADRWAVHAFGGALYPFGDTTLFEDYENVDLDPVWAGGLGLVGALTETLALGIQVEANTSAFGDVPFLDGDPVTLFAGIRKAAGAWLFEGGAGAGLNDSATDGQVMVAASRRF